MIYIIDPEFMSQHFAIKNSDLFLTQIFDLFGLRNAKLDSFVRCIILKTQHRNPGLTTHSPIRLRS